MADITNSVWNEVDASNSSSGTTPGFPEGAAPSSLNNNLRGLMGAVKRWFDRTNPTLTSSGSANSHILTYDVPPDAYVLGDIYRFIAGFTNSGATTLNINSLGDISVLCNGLALSGGEIVADQVCIVAFDSSTNFQLLNPQNRVFGDLKVDGDLHLTGDETVGGTLTVTGDSVLGDVTANSLSVTNDISVLGGESIAGSLTVGGTANFNGAFEIDGNPITFLTANKYFYISTVGSDSVGDGSIGAPWATPSHAYSVIASTTNFGTFTINVLLEPGTYTATSTFFSPAVGNWWIGSSTLSAPDVVINCTGFQQDGIHPIGTAQVTASHLTVSAAGGYALASSGTSQLNLDVVDVGTSVGHIAAFDGGNINILNNYAILGDANSHYLCEHGTLTASSSGTPIVVTSSGSIAFTEFALCDGGGFIRAVDGDFSGISATGIQFAITSNGVIFTGGEDPDLYFPPGDASGTLATGGVWV